MYFICIIYVLCMYKSGESMTFEWDERKRKATKTERSVYEDKFTIGYYDILFDRLNHRINMF